MFSSGNGVGLKCKDGCMANALAVHTLAEFVIVLFFYQYKDLIVI